MKKINHLAIVILVLFTGLFVNAQSFKDGERLKLKISYSNFINAGSATLTAKEVTYDGKKMFHVRGVGETSGLIKMAFKVNDDYQSYFDASNGRVYRYIRKINEGGYTKNEEGFFNYNKKQVLVKDHQRGIERNVSFTSTKIQDLLSSFYYLRNHSKINTMKKGEVIEIDTFFDDDSYKFRLKLLGKEEIKTKFGTIKALKFRPYVQSGRVFKEEESVTVWVSDDDNKIVLKVKASLAVGSLNADIDEYSGLKHSITFKK